MFQMLKLTVLVNDTIYTVEIGLTETIDGVVSVIDLGGIWNNNRQRMVDVDDELFGLILDEIEATYQPILRRWVEIITQ